MKKLLKGNEKVKRIIPVDPNSPKTIKFLEFVVEKILEYQPFTIGEPVRVWVSSETDPFPKFKENVFDDDSDKYLSHVITDLDNMNVEKVFGIWEYLLDLLEAGIVAEVPTIKNNNPLAIYIPFIVKNPKKIYEKAKNLNINFYNEVDKHSNKTALNKSHAPQIYYDKKTGRGYINGRLLKFSKKSQGFRVFGALYTNINNPLTKYKILGLIQNKKIKTDQSGNLIKNENGEYPIEENIIFIINDMANKLRKKLKINAEKLPMNNGDLTLVGEKLKYPPR